MAATTRARTGNSKPRVLAAITSTSTSTSTTTSTKAKAKANTSKPRATKAKPARVLKVKNPRTKTQQAVDKIVGSGEEVVRDGTGKKAAGTRKGRGTERVARKGVV